MTKTPIVAAVSAAFLLTVPPAFAQRGQGAKPTQAPHTVNKMHGPAPTTQAGSPKLHASTTHASKGASTHVQKGPGTHAAKGPGTHTTKGASGTHTSKGSTTHTSKGAKSPKTSTTGSTNGSTTTGTQTNLTLSPVQQKLQRNTNLTSKLESRLPAGTDPMLASAGFKNLGQFVAAVNVSHNLGIPFDELRSRMVNDGMSLGQAIQASKPTSNTELEVQRAETEAQTMIADTEGTTQQKTKKRTDRNAPRQ